MTTDPYYRKENIMETVTIPRDVYEVLAKAYTSVRQREYADSIAATVRSLTSEELDALPSIIGHPEPDATLPTSDTVEYVEEMRRDGTIYKDKDGDHWRWNNDTLEVRETAQDEPEFYEFVSSACHPNAFAPFTPIS